MKGAIAKMRELRINLVPKLHLWRHVVHGHSKSNYMQFDECVVLR